MTELRSGAYRSRRTVWEFLKGFAKVVIGGALLLQAFLFISVFALLLSILGAVSEGIEQSKAPDVRANIKAGTTLYFNPVGILAETSPGRDPIEEALDEVFGGRIGPVGIHDLVRVIQTAKDDERISAMVVDLQELAIPNIYLSKANLLADAIEEFRDAGKRVWAVGDYYTQGQYLIASEADEILLNHQGGVMLDGYGNYRLYYASLLERLDVTSHVFRVGTYKSAVEPYLRDDMSPEAKEAASKYLQVLWDATTSRIEANRPIGPGTAKVYAETLPAVVRSSGGDLAEAAKSAGLVDRIVTRQELESFLTDKVGEDEDGELNTVEFVDYADDVKPPRNRPTIDDVMIVTVQGPIMDGDNEPGVASGEYVSEKLREARETESVKAVVLRVDSPGGS
ncbi:MAG: S49 family peptidase, partial [Pseudomonadota bacterium]